MLSSNIAKKNTHLIGNVTQDVKKSLPLIIETKVFCKRARLQNKGNYNKLFSSQVNNDAYSPLKKERALNTYFLSNTRGFNIISGSAYTLNIFATIRLRI